MTSQVWTVIHSRSLKEEGSTRPTEQTVNLTAWGRLKAKGELNNSRHFTGFFYSSVLTYKLTQWSALKSRRGEFCGVLSGWITKSFKGFNTSVFFPLWIRDCVILHCWHSVMTGRARWFAPLNHLETRHQKLFGKGKVLSKR